MPWLIGCNVAPERVLAQHGWTKQRAAGLEFRTDQDAQNYIDEQRITGHPVQVTEAEKTNWTMRGTVQTDYDPFGLARR